MKAEWRTVPLGDLVDFVGGGTPRRDNPAYWGGDIPWASVKDITDHDLQRTAETITQAGVENSATNIIEAGRVILASRVGLGKVCINRAPVAINQDLKALIPKSDNILPRFLLHFIISQANAIERSGVGATVMGVTIPQLQRMKIPLPQFPEQERIVCILDAAEELRRLRAQADRRTADLIPALFYDMFGDPATNSKNWEMASVGTLFQTDRPGARCGPFGSALKKQEYVDGGIPVWGIENVQPNRFVEEGSLFVTEDKYAELTNYSVQSGDILISRAGTVGRMCVARPRQSPSIIGTNLIRLALDAGAIQPEYFTALYTHFAEQMGRLRANADEGAYSFMNTTVLKSLTIPLPPLALQRQFGFRVGEIRALEARQAESRRRLDDLFQSLLHRAFQGEL